MNITLQPDCFITLLSHAVFHFDWLLYAVSLNFSCICIPNVFHWTLSGLNVNRSAYVWNMHIYLTHLV